MRRLLWTVSSCAVALCLAACPSEDEGKDGAEKKADEKEGEQDDAGSLQVAQGDGGVDGPVPPDTSMVFFAVEGALYPLGCFDKDAGSIESGDACLKMVKVGDAVRVASHDSQYNKEAGEPVEPQCMAGLGKKIAIGVEGITEGADFKYGTWPPSGIKVVEEVDPESTKPSALHLSDDEESALLEAIKAAGGSTGETLEAHQVAEIKGLTPKDKVFSVYVPNPKVIEQYKWSGVFVAEGGDLKKLTLLAKSKTKKDVFEVRGSLDLDGDGTNELWTRLVFAEGGGDRLMSLKPGSAEPIGDWSCGAVR